LSYPPQQAQRLFAIGTGRATGVDHVFAVKQTGRDTPVSADYWGVKLPDRCVFGFGMDVHGYWRNLPAVYALKT
jgi:hypoxanthine phosphoribosyltransferase